MASENCVDVDGIFSPRAHVYLCVYPRDEASASLLTSLRLLTHKAGWLALRGLAWRLA